jgi:hypothetical protein
MTFDDYMKRIMEDNKEILEALGSDFDEEGVPYWEKWGSKSKFDSEFDVDKTLRDAVD